MPALFPPQHERFAIELSLLKKPIEAYTLAGYVPDRGNARKLARKPFIQERVRELQERHKELATIEGAAIIVEIGRIALANIRDFYNRDGSLKPLHEIPARLTAAIAGVEYDSQGRMTYKMWDKNQANFTLLKHLGGLPEPDGARTQVNVFNALSIDDQAALADLIEAIPGRPNPAGAEAAGERSAG